MTVQIANTELSSNFNTWRLNTNLIATTISNNVITVAKEGRGGYTVGSGHVSGKLSAVTLAATTLVGGNTSVDSDITISSNTIIGGNNLGTPRSLTVYANTTFQGNVIVATSGEDIFDQGDVSRIRITGGTNGQYLRKIGTNGMDFETLTLRQISDLSSNSAHLILSGANSAFSDNGDSTHLIFGSVSDRIHLYLAKEAISGDSDLFLNLADTNGDSRFVIADSSNNVVGYIDSQGNANLSGSLSVEGDVTLGDASTDTITVKGNFANQSTSGAATFNGATTFNGTSTFNGTMNINGNVNVGDAASDIMNVTSRSDLFGATNIGNANTDTVTVLAEVDSDFVPSADNTYLLGKKDKEWKHVFANNVSSYNLSVDGQSTFNGDMVLGNETADTITVKGNFANQHTEGLATFGDRVGIATSSITSGYVAEIDGKVYIHDDILAANNLVVHGDLDVDGSITLPSDAIVTIATAIFDDITVTQDAIIGNDATDNHTITGSVTISGDVDHNGNLDVSDAIKNDGVTVVSKLGKIHANNAILDGNIKSAMLANSGVTSGSYGSSTSIPVLTINNKGQVTSATTQTVAGVTGLTYTQSNNNIRVSTADGKTWDDSIDPATTTSGTGRGVASFDSGDFDVSSGHVSLKNATTGAVLAINGTTKEVNVSRTNGTVTVGLPDDVTVAGTLIVNGDSTVGGQLNVGENVVISGNLVVQGTTTTVNTETVNIADNQIVLNSNYTGSTPSENGGIEIERGTLANKTFVWDETNDRWTVGSETMVAGTFIGDVTGDVTGNADTATALETARTIGGVSFNGTANINLPGVNIAGNQNTSGNAATATKLATARTIGGVSFDGSANINLPGVNTAGNQDTSGNADTATALETARTIGGVSFDGTANINLPGVNAAGNQNTSGNAATATKLATARTITLDGDVSGSTTFDGSANKTITVTVADDSHNHIISNVDGLQTALNGKLDTTHDMTLTLSGDASGSATFTNMGNATLSVTVANDSHSHSNYLPLSGGTVTGTITHQGSTFTVGNSGSSTIVMVDTDHGNRSIHNNSNQIGFLKSDNNWGSYCDDNGNWVSVGDVTAYSDIRLKSDIETIGSALDKVKNLRGCTYIKDEKRSIGVIAQEIEKIIPEVVSTADDEMGTKSVAYGNIVAVLIEAIKELSDKVDRLDNK